MLKYIQDACLFAILYIKLQWYATNTSNHWKDKRFGWIRFKFFFWRGCSRNNNGCCIIINTFKHTFTQTTKFLLVFPFVMNVPMSKVQRQKNCWRKLRYNRVGQLMVTELKKYLNVLEHLIIKAHLPLNVPNRLTGRNVHANSQTSAD